MLKYTFIAAVLLVAGAQFAHGQTEQDHRCSRDSLDVNQAVERLYWAKNRSIPIAGAPLTEAGVQGLIHAWDWHPTLKGRPKYPTFGVPAGANVWTYPGNWKAPVNRNSTAGLPANYVMSAICTSSCYKPGMRILLPAGYEEVSEAAQNELNKILVLDDSSTLDKPVLKQDKVFSYTISLDDVEHKIAVIRTEAGTTLKVTGDHTFIDGEGALREAASLRAGDSLVRMDGQTDKIIGIAVEDYYGKVYNVTPDNRSMMGQILVAEGYLTGSAYYQNVQLTDANRHLFRANIPDELIESL